MTTDAERMERMNQACKDIAKAYGMTSEEATAEIRKAMDSMIRGQDALLAYRKRTSFLYQYGAPLLWLAFVVVLIVLAKVLI